MSNQFAYPALRNGHSGDRNDRISGPPSGPRRKRRRRRRRQQSTATLLTIVGGTASAAAKKVGVERFGITTYVDVLSEIRALDPDGELTAVELGGGHTAKTLLQSDPHALPAVKDFVDARPGFNIDDGGGQCPGLASSIGRLSEDQLRDAADAAYDDAFVANLGNAETVTHTSISGAAGAIGSGITPPVELAFSKQIIPKLSGAYNSVRVRCGPLTYNQCGEFTQRNGAATIARDIQWATAPDKHPSETRTLFLGEFAELLGDDKESRDQQIAFFLQAFFSPGLQEVLTRTRPNAALTPLGGIYILNAAYEHPISDVQIIDHAAREYIPQLDEIIATPSAQGVVQGFEVVREDGVYATEYSRDELLQRIRRSPRVEPNGFSDACFKILAPTQTAAAIVLLSGQQKVYGGSAELAPYDVSPADLAACRQMLSTARAIAGALELDLAERELELKKLRHHSQTAATELKAAIAALYPEGRLKRVMSCFSSVNARLSRWISARRAWEKHGPAKQRAQDHHRVLSAAYASVQQDIARQEMRLHRCISALKDVQLHHDGDPQRLLGVAPLDEVLPQLFLATASRSGAREAVVELLARSTRHVTMEGLAVIAGVESSDPEQIAAALADGNPPHQCAFWGAKTPSHEEEQFVVLPPMLRADSEQVESELKRFLDVNVCHAAGAFGGATVTHLSLTKPRSRDEILTPYLRTQLELAEQQPHLHFPN